MMAETKLIAICQLGGEFEIDKDGSLPCRGGDAYAIDIDDQMKFNDFKMEVAEMLNSSINTMCLYFLPGNRKTLITISNDKDLKWLLNFQGDLSPLTFITTFSEAPSPVPLAVWMGFWMIDQPLDISPILPLVDSIDDRHAKGAQQWQNTITGVGQRFSSVNEFRESLRKYAIAHQFAFWYKKNDSHRVTVKCKAEDCPCRIHASRLSTTQLICVKKMNPTHTCEGSVATTGYQATRSWVASIIKESWASDAHELPITQMVEAIRAGSTFEVRGESMELVDIDRWDCCCKGWQLTGLPCCHAVAVISCIGRSPYEFCSRYFTTESCRLTYSESVNPIPNMDWPVQNDSSEDTVTVTPPPTRCPPGRPSAKRCVPQDVVKRQLQCSRCKGLGHNKSICKELLYNVG
ncbi:hypothetical protein GH714_006521 [Hevea brasiliensis]|uniref:SWIM-type domain-containing protein n=1 Tax=Hevea brasiliensis TaxID=3981 RepID=A0A6A6NFZ5_HEVBR|nr:hypothetical protein GH714_006521 [Hevea brasiliensis]